MAQINKIRVLKNIVDKNKSYILVVGILSKGKTDASHEKDWKCMFSTI